MIAIDRLIAEGKTDVTWEEACGFHPGQSLCLEAAKRFDTPVILGGGSGFGGKSYMLRSLAVWIRLRRKQLGQPAVPGVLACSSFEALKDRHYAALQREWGHMGKLVSNHRLYGRSFVFKDPDLGPICLRNMKDPSERKGTEYGDGLLDELTECTREQFGDFCYMIRSPLVPWRPIICATNPDGIGHYHAKDLFRPQLVPHGERSLDAILNIPQRSEPYSERVDPTGLLDPKDYIYIPFLPDDNPLFDEKTFMRAIAHLPPHIQKARRYGSWDAPEGARFRHANPDEMIFNRREVFPKGIPHDWPIILHCDYGIRAPYCALWTAIDPEGNAWTYREDYMAGLTADMQAARICEKTGLYEKISRTKVDPAMYNRFARTTSVVQEEPTVAEIYDAVFARSGKPIPSCERGFNKDRSMAFATLDRLMVRGNGFPNWYIEQGCVNLWSEITGAVFKSGAGFRDLSEDIDERCPDHALTAAYYGLHDYYAPDVMGDTAPLAPLSESFDDVFGLDRYPSGGRRVIKLT